MAAGDAIRKYVSGAGWQTVAPDDSGGGGGSLPDWWTVDSTPSAESVEFAGTVTIDPSDPDVDRLVVQQDDANVFQITSGGRVNIDAPDDFPDFGPMLDFGASAVNLGDDPFIRVRKDGDPVFVLGPTGAVTVSPSDPDAVGLTITGGVGTVRLPHFGAIEGDATEPGSVGLTDSVTYAGDGDGIWWGFSETEGEGEAYMQVGGDYLVHAQAGKLGFYSATPVTQPTGVAVDAAGIHAALVTLGLITA